jgi:hypothetical protein
MTRRSVWTIAFTCLLVTLFSGCRSTTPPVSYYTLSSIPAPASRTPAGEPFAVTIGIQPLELPGYVNRTHMTTRSSAHRLTISSLHRWADYPDRLVQQVLGDNLSVLIPRARVVNPPWPVGLNPDISLAVQFTELIKTPDKDVLLSAVWIISDTTEQTPMQSHRILLTEPVDGSGYDELAAAHSRLLEKLCRSVTASLEPVIVKVSGSAQ